MDELVISTPTQRLLGQYTANPTHALMIVGPDGVGKGSVAQYLIRQVLKLAPNTDIKQNQHVTYIEPDEKNTISIERIRDVQGAIKLKTAGKHTIRRAVLIEHAQHMTTEAQNALLKVLEEPPLDTIIILTINQAQGVLSTIQSRTQQLAIAAPQKPALLSFFKKDYDGKQVMQAYFLSGGLPGLMHALLEKDQDHPLLQSVEMAKGLLRGQLFERMLYIESVAKQRESAIALCEALERIAQAGLYAAAEKSEQARIKQWHAILKQSQEAQEFLRTNANTKLVLTNLILQL